MTRRAYIAEYPDPDTEVILFEDTYWSPRLSAQFDALVGDRPIGSPLIQAWYYDPYQTTCMGVIR